MPRRESWVSDGKVGGLGRYWSALLCCPRPEPRWGNVMSRYPDELGEWWTGFPGSDAAAWAAPSPRSAGAVAPAEKGIRGAFSRRAAKHGLVVAPGKRERAKREEAAEWRRQTVEAIRAPRSEE